MNRTIFILLAALALPFSNCKKGDTQLADHSQVLQNLGTDVVLATYAEMDAKSQALLARLTALEAAPSAANLESARQAWREARVPWEQSEGFLYGPVDQQGIDPAIDSWPVNQPDLDAVLSSSNALTKAYIDGLDGTLKGFHTIEYLIFGSSGDKAFSDFTPRQFEYLRACAESLNGAIHQLYTAWNPAGGNYVANITGAGKPGNTVYPSQKAALEEIVNGLVTIADEVANGKINDPFSQQNVNLEESRFSANSKADFADNIRSIRNAYTGVFKNASGLGISSIIAAKDADLDAKTRQQIDAAIAAIEAIPGTFTTAIFEAKPSVENAQQKVRDLQQTLESGVLPIISNL